MRDKRDEPKRPVRVRPVLMSLALSLVSSLAVLLAASALVLSGMLPQGRMPVAAGFACLAGAFIAGARGVSMMKTKFLLAGVAGGFVYFLTLFLLGALFFLRGMPSASSPVTLMLVMGLAGGLIAGILGTMRKPRNPRLK